MNQQIFVKNMVCDRCIRIVREELEMAGFSVFEIRLGKVVIASKFNIYFKSMCGPAHQCWA